MTLDLTWNGEQQAIAESVAKLAREKATPQAIDACTGRFPSELWHALAELGVLALGTIEGGGGALEIVAACEQLGRAAFPGPIADTFLATQLVDDAEREQIGSGKLVAAVAVSRQFPWWGVAKAHFEIDGCDVHRVEPGAGVQPFTTIAGEGWCDAGAHRLHTFTHAERAIALHRVGSAAYLAGAGLGLVATTAEHAAVRHQFGKPIGKFQAVAHPLADSWMQLTAAQTLTRNAACDLDGGALERALALASAAWLSGRRAALEAANTCHQAFGALGITVEGPVYRVSRRIRQLASTARWHDPARDAVLAHFGIVPHTAQPRPGERS